TRSFGPIRPAASAELRARVDRLAAVVRAGAGVPKPGKRIFDRNCARCHTLFGQGNKVGPDLTTYRRDDLETMLLNIVNPGAEIPVRSAILVFSATLSPRSDRVRAGGFRPGSRAEYRCRSRWRPASDRRA